MQESAGGTQETGALSAEATADQRGRRGAGEPTARWRLESLLDPGTFVELGGFAGAEAGQGDQEAAPAPAVAVGPGPVAAGFGTVGGREVAVFALEPASGRVLDEGAAARILRVQELALRNRVPMVAVDGPVDPDPEGGIAALAGWTAVLAGYVAASGVIPQIGVTTRAGGPAEVPSRALVDLAFAVAGPGSPGRNLAHFPCSSEAECWDGVRRLLSHLPSSARERPPRLPGAVDPERTDPELHRLIPERAGAPYDARELVRRLLDDRELMEVHPQLAPNLVAGLGRLDGYPVGVVASQPAVAGGALDGAAAAKAARFVRFCDAFNLSLVALVDSPGWAADREDLGAGPAGASGTMGADLFSAWVEASVPKLTVLIGNALGAGYQLMAPRQAGADLNLAWPRARIAVARAGASAGTARAADAYAAAERGIIDRVIEPRETRRELIHGLELCLGKTVERPDRKHRTGGSW